MIQKCSVCNWFVVDTDDKYVDIIKKRHEDWHDPNTTSYKRNTAMGKVEWIEV